MKPPNLLSVFLAASTALCFAQAPAAPPAKPATEAVKPAAETTPPKPDETPVVRSHELTVGGRTLRYKTTAGLMPIRNKAGETEAHIFFMAYTLEGTTDAAKRRLTFSFNGGPGSSSVWLHLGVLGPKRVKMQDDGALPKPPYQLVPNETTWLDETDIVFIDPVGTGYSRAVKPELQKKFSSFKGDIDSVGEFIRMYLTRNNRWMSPLFVIGESYGTTRAASLTGALINEGIAFNGVLLVSTILSFQTTDTDRGNDLPYPLMLPTYTATAWYHKRLPADLQKRELRDVLKEVEAWATSGYMDALTKGDRLTAAERKAVAEKLARYTGVDAAYVERSDLRMPLSQYNRELLRDKGLVVGRLDSRLTGPARRDAGSSMDHDPAMSTIRPPYTAAFYQYVRDELGYQVDQPYYILGGGVDEWDTGAKDGYLNVSDYLRTALTNNPYMKVYLGAGYYDMATPYYAAFYTLDHMGLPADLRSNIRIHQYESGHMYYIHLPSLAQMKKDGAAFLEWAAPLK